MNASSITDYVAMLLSVGSGKLYQIDKISSWQKTLANGHSILMAIKTSVNQTNVLIAPHTSNSQVSINCSAWRLVFD